MTPHASAAGRGEVLGLSETEQADLVEYLKSL